MAVTGMGTEGDDVFEDLASLRRRIVSELVDLNLHLPGRKPTRRQRVMRLLRGGRRRSFLERLGS